MNIEKNNEYKYDIFNFLDEHIVENGKVHTHTSMHNPKASYFIKPVDLNIFFELYEQAILNGYELHITEKRQEFFPITIDLDFKYELETFQRKHTETHIKKIIDLYNNEIINILDIDKDDPKLTSFVFERDESYKAKGITKDGIHIQFPFIVTYPSVQYYIRDNILKKIGDIISDMGLKNSISDIVDRTVISPNTLWLLYGSNKDKPKGNPYKLKYIYNGNNNNLSIEDYFGNQNINLARFFSIRDKKESEIIPIKDDKLHLIESNNKKKATKKIINNINYDPVRIKELVFILNNERADNFNQWLELGWALHNIDPNSQELLDIWIEFSKKSPKYKEGECEKIWEKSKNEGLTIACIHYWAKIDNKKKYDEFKDKDITKWIDASVKTQSNYDIAYVLFKMYEYDFVFSDNDWYIYKNHIWHRENDGMSLRQKISNELCKNYVKLMSYYNQVASGQIKINGQELTEEEKEEYKKKNGVVLEVIKKVKTTAFKENIMKECKELFSNKDFVKKLDSNPYLIGFSNGIYDLKKGELRDGRPDDYIEMSTEIDKIDFDENHEYWFELQNFINTVFFDEEIRTYFLTYFASCLQGHNAEEKFRIWTGVGCHAFDTDIMMFDGTTKKVQDIIIGDKIMGDDSTERNVLELKYGFSDMYEFKGNLFNSFVVNGDHILCLYYEKSDYTLSYIEISVKNFINIKNKEKYFLFDKNKNLYQFDYTKVNNNYFYGFELDNNHCYIMGNGIVTHNSNGKSKILELFVHCLGMYSIKFPITMLTGKRAASNACTPEIVQSKGKRFGYFEEPSENERINAGLLKEFTGGDKIKARGLHKEPIEFKPQFKLALLCNEMPEVPPNDSGTWRRMEVIEFKSRFCENPKESHEFPIDKYLSEKLKNWKELFMALLLDIYYEKYKKNGIKVPMEIIKFTLEYQKQCDLYTDFISENLEETKENADIIDITQLYDEFKIWYESTFSNHKYPSKIEFKKYLKKKYTTKRMSATEIKGFKFKVKHEKKINEPQLMHGY
jgi:P4 family phage/plasmid primase-like protien